MQRIVALPQKEFDDSLAEVKTTLAVAKSESISVPVPEVQKKLKSSDRDKPEFWQASASLINYRSMQPPTANLPDCLDDLNPRGSMYLAHGSKEVKDLKLPTYSNCKIALDDPRAREVFDREMRTLGLVMNKCLVLWHGGPIVLPANAPASLRFVDCYFEFTPGVPPDKPGKTLLASVMRSPDPSSMTVNFAN
jgi:hypothetical protein